MYNNLKSSRKVAEFYGVSHGTVLDFAHKIGYDVELKELLTKEEIQEIIQLYNDETSITLGEKYNVSSSLISKIWRENGLLGRNKNKYSLNKKYFSKIDSPDKAYFLGFIGADGCLYKRNDSSQGIIRIGIQKEDIKILELFRQVLNTNKPISYSKKGKYVNLEIVCQEMFEDICKLGLLPNKTYSNTIANIPEKFMPHLLRGYFDGDGSIHKDSKSDVGISFSGYENNLIKIKDFLEKKNIFPIFTIDKRRYTVTENTGNFGTLNIQNRVSKYSFLKMIYKDCEDFYMDRKFLLANDFINYIEKSENPRDKQIKIYYDYAVQRVS